MEEQKIKNLLKFYLLATELKDKIRSGWKVWNIDRERVESVAEHIYGTCILVISIDSQFDLDIDLYKVITMLVLHEIEEIKIGDLSNGVKSPIFTSSISCNKSIITTLYKSISNLNSESIDTANIHVP